MFKTLRELLLNFLFPDRQLKKVIKEYKENLDKIEEKLNHINNLVKTHDKELIQTARILLTIGENPSREWAAQASQIISLMSADIEDIKEVLIYYESFFSEEDANSAEIDIFQTDCKKNKKKLN